MDGCPTFFGAQAHNSLLQAPDRRRDPDRPRGPADRRRGSQQPGVLPPSPALVRHGSKQRRGPGGGALSPGGASHGTPGSAIAVANVQIGSSPGTLGTPPHPYA